jgi:uncharacterized protein with gpF-like domain
MKVREPRGKYQTWAHFRQNWARVIDGSLEEAKEAFEDVRHLMPSVLVNTETGDILKHNAPMLLPDNFCSTVL